jgi:hypothetical protein
MMKKWVLAVALLSLAISMGCRNVKSISKVQVSVSDGNLSVLYVTQVVTFTATVTGTSNTAVNWSLTADIACTGNPNPCGTLTPSGNTAQYTAPASSPGNNVNINITATSQADSSISDTLSVKVHQITVVITPISPNVGVNLTQQFVAVAVPDDAPQTFTWGQPTCTSAPCGTITVPDANNTALVVYTAPGSPSPTNDIKFIATSTVDTTGFTQATATVVKSRLIAGATYAFRFSGFDKSGNATSRAGNFAVANDGSTISGVEDDLTTGGPQHCALTGSYATVSNNNNVGTITLKPCSATNIYTAVLDANGDVEMIESGSNGKGSGVIEQVTGKFSNNASLSGAFVFGFAGVDSAGKRVGHVGLANMDGSGGISNGGLMDTNDNGTASSASDISGSYSMVNGIGSMTLTSPTLGKTFSFKLYGTSGQLKGNDPATLYAINTDPIGNNSAVAGTVVFQDPNGQPYNTATFKSGNASVVSLTGVDSIGDSNVSLSLFATDGAGNLFGNFDQNDGGTILSVANFSTGYTYAGTGLGRYTFKLLGNPNANPVVPPLNFVLYASGANKGFLLDQSSQSVITGTMYLQTAPKAQAHIFASSNFPGTWAAATTSSGASGVDPIAANLLLTWVNDETCTNQCVDGTQYDASGGTPLTTETYAIQADGFGKFSPIAPATTPNYVIYAIDITHFLVMDVDSTNTNASIINAQQ